MLAAAVILAFAIFAHAAPAVPQVATPAPRNPAPHDPTQEVKGSGIIRGRITSLDTGMPLRRAHVSITEEGIALPPPPRTASTSNDGRYEIRDIPPGRYSLRVQRSGYLALNYGQRRPGEQARPLEIADKEVVEKVDFALARMGIISGRVLDDLGEPVVAATVWAMQMRYFDGRRKLVPAGASARTDVTGQYRLLSLSPGDYVVMGTTAETWPLDSDPKQVFAYAPTYFPGTSDPAVAGRVRIELGKETPGIDISLVPGRTARVSGTATSASGLPLAGESVGLLQETVGPTVSMASWAASAKVAGDGSWVLSSVPPGEYRLTIRTPARGDQPAQEGNLVINVAGADLEGLSLVAGGGAIVRGQVVTDDGSPLPAGIERMQVRPPFTPGSSRVTSIPSPDNGRVRSDGTFEVRGFPADTVLSIGPLPGDWTLKAVEVDGRDVTDYPLPVEHGATLSGVRIVLTSRPTVLRGVLRDEKRNPAEGTVIVFAADSARRREGSRAIRVTRPDQRGWFTFTGLPAGDYLLIALDYVLEGQWQDPEFLDGLKPRARRVSLADAESKQVDLVVRK